VAVFLVGDELDVGAVDAVLDSLDGRFDDQSAVRSVFRAFEVRRPGAIVDAVGTGSVPWSWSCSGSLLRGVFDIALEQYGGG
jgi:hypothetical protein